MNCAIKQTTELISNITFASGVAARAVVTAFTILAFVYNKFKYCINIYTMSCEIRRCIIREDI